MRAFFSDDTPLDLPAGHRFPVEKYRLLRAQVADELPGVRLCPAPTAEEQDLLLAHTSAYVKSVLDGSLDIRAQREIGFIWSENMVLRSLRSVGATLAAAHSALEEGIAVNLAGGTHHASAGKGSGFCVFNDVAVAARAIQLAERLKSPYAAGHGPRSMQMAVIDLDVHQGDGTASIFAEDPSVFTLSMHGEKNFPFKKTCSDLDIELTDGCCDERYLEELDDALKQLWSRTWERPPELIFYLAGCDVHQADRLGRLKLTADGVKERDRRVLQAARDRGIPVVMAMAGGYGRDISRMVRLQVESVRQAWLSWQATQDTRSRRTCPSTSAARDAVALS